MYYDEQVLAHLEGEARAAAFWLGKVLPAVQNRLAADLAAFDVTTTTPAEIERRLELETLLSAMQAFSETATAYNGQMEVNLRHVTAIMQQEATRAAFFKEQFALTHADWVKQKEQNLADIATFQGLLARRAA